MDVTITWGKSLSCGAECQIYRMRAEHRIPGDFAPHPNKTAAPSRRNVIKDIIIFLKGRQHCPYCKAMQLHVILQVDVLGPHFCVFPILYSSVHMQQSGCHTAHTGPEVTKHST